MDLSDFGWDGELEKGFRSFMEAGFSPARIIGSNRLDYELMSEGGLIRGKLSGKFRGGCHSKDDYPTVGDWVAFKPNDQTGYPAIHGMLPRRSKFSRKVAGKAMQEQVIAANIDTVFIVSGLDADFSIRRLERYAALAADSNAELVFLLNKADICKDLAQVVSEVGGLFKNVPVYALSALKNQGIEQTLPHLKPGKTVVFLGSSGAGKSTIINLLIGEERQKTGSVSTHDGRGRHITTSKNLILLPSGAIVIDTPGLREVQLLKNDAGLKNAFSDIEEYAHECKYKNCTHTNEQGCAVILAVSEGKISEDRLKNYHKLKKEIAHNLSRHEKQYKNKRGKFWKTISKKSKLIKKSRESIREGLGDIDY
ncbi:MAG: ribosome small subunit-dependent GTPase A [Candidatus Altiarchaeota archaeon]|nr:ribosome small subunit-dependent GTPase A [Candidatus Altiarchaeota archaeon]